MIHITTASCYHQLYSRSEIGVLSTGVSGGLPAPSRDHQRRIKSYEVAQQNLKFRHTIILFTHFLQSRVYIARLCKKNPNQPANPHPPKKPKNKTKTKKTHTKDLYVCFPNNLPRYLFSEKIQLHKGYLQKEAFSFLSVRQIFTGRSLTSCQLPLHTHTHTPSFPHQITLFVITN